MIDRKEKAYPSTYKNLSETEQTHYFGMDLRDYFAAKALQGMLSAEVNAWNKTHETYEFYLNDLTTSAYLMADTMMKVREPNDAA